MSRVLRSMTYRLIRNKLFWLILAALVVLEVLTLFYGSSDGGRYSECFVNHKTYTRHDHDSEIEVSEYAEFEKEDPLLINISIWGNTNLFPVRLIISKSR